jgi:hypothetical protein
MSVAETHIIIIVKRQHPSSTLAVNTRRQHSPSTPIVNTRRQPHRLNAHHRYHNQSIHQQ